MTKIQKDYTRIILALLAFWSAVAVLIYVAVK
jgi:hypothetical protein